MKTIPFPPEQANNEEWYNNNNIGICDTNNSYEALENVDRVLEEFGLEILIYDSGSSDYFFTVGKREVNPERK